MEPNDALTLSTVHFLSLAANVEPSDYAAASPCDDWTVADLLRHVAMGSAMATALVNGASRDEATAFFGQAISDNPVQECHDALAQQLETLESVSDLDQIVHHPIGDVQVRQLIDFRISDLTVHSWDLARAIGDDEELPESLVEHVYGVFQPLEPVIGSLGLFGDGPSGTLESDASLQSKLLDLLGRRP